MQLSDAVSLPVVPGSDVVGTVFACGNLRRVEEEFDISIGTRVAALTRSGGNARFVVVPASSLVTVPTSVRAADAACTVSAYMSAYQAIKLAIRKERNLVGSNILVIGGTGPIGQAMIEVAYAAGAAHVFATAPAKHHKYVKENLKAIPLPTDSRDWIDLVRGEMDAVFDISCKDVNASREACNETGDLVCIGMYGLLNEGSMGLFGAPLSAYWTKTKSGLFMSRTHVYESWESFTRDPETFKVSEQMCAFERANYSFDCTVGLIFCICIFYPFNVYRETWNIFSIDYERSKFSQTLPNDLLCAMLQMVISILKRERTLVL